MKFKIESIEPYSYQEVTTQEQIYRRYSEDCWFRIFFNEELEQDSDTTKELENAYQEYIVRSLIG